MIPRAPHHWPEGLLCTPRARALRRCSCRRSAARRPRPPCSNQAAYKQLSQALSTGKTGAGGRGRWPLDNNRARPPKRSRRSAYELAHHGCCTKLGLQLIVSTSSSGLRFGVCGQRATRECGRRERAGRQSGTAAGAAAAPCCGAESSKQARAICPTRSPNRNAKLTSRCRPPSRPQTPPCFRATRTRRKCAWRQHLGGGGAGRGDELAS